MTGIQATHIETAEKPLNPRKQGGGWDEAKLERAKALAAEKKTAREIADILGEGISRSAVICKLRRANVELQNAPAGGRGVNRKGITKGKGYRAAGKAPRPRRKDMGIVVEGIPGGTVDSGQILIRHVCKHNLFFDELSWKQRNFD